MANISEVVYESIKQGVRRLIQHQCTKIKKNLVKYKHRNKGINSKTRRLIHSNQNVSI